MILKTQGVSFPRSGHGALYHILRHYFGDALVYCDPEVRRSQDAELDGLCGCGQVPCVNPDNNFAKNHDFGLLHEGPSVPIRPEWRYLIQYRNPVRAITSDFYLHLKRRPEHNYLTRWRSFAFEKVRYWNRFMDKWVLKRNPTGLKRLFRKPATFLDLPYEDLISRPTDACSRVIAYLSTEPIDGQRLQQALDVVGLRPLDRFQGFQFFDTGFFAELEHRTETRMAEAGVPSYADSL